MTAGCVARGIHLLVQVLYALNETYFISEKKVSRDVDLFCIKPENFITRITTILGNIGTSRDALDQTVAEAEALLEEMNALSDIR